MMAQSSNYNLLQENQARYNEFEDFESEIKAVILQKLLEADKQRRFSRPVCRQATKLLKTGKPLGKLLTETGYVAAQELETALNLQAMLDRLDNHLPLGKLLVEGGYVTAEQLAEVLQAQRR